MNKMRHYYPKIIALSRVNKAADQSDLAAPAQDLENKDPLALLSDFYHQVTGEELSDNQRQWAKDALLAAQKEEEG